MNPPTKYEILAVKLGKKRKLSFVKHCRQDGLTLTEVVNSLVDLYIEDAKKRLKTSQEIYSNG